MPPYQEQQDQQQQQDQETPIRCTGPYQVTPSLWLSPVLLSDTAELCRILNIDDSIHNGLHSAKMVFPFSEEAARYFTARHLSKRVKEGTCTEWAIRTKLEEGEGEDGTMIGLMSLSPFDH
ncbi:hypothetical protein BGZ95_008234, partial [Linnemannia exigua]